MPLLPSLLQPQDRRESSRGLYLSVAEQLKSSPILSKHTFHSPHHYSSQGANCKDVKGNFVPVLLPSKTDYSTIHDLLPHHPPYRLHVERREVSSSKTTSPNNPDLGVGASTTNTSSV